MNFETMTFTPEAAAAPFKAMADHNLRLIEKMRDAGFDGSVELDATLNGAQQLIHLSGEVVASMPQGRFSCPEADRYVKTTLELLKAVKARYGVAVAKPMQQAFCANFNLWHDVKTPTHPAGHYIKAVFASCEKIVNAICESNLAIATIPRRPAYGGEESRVELSQELCAAMLGVSVRQFQRYEKNPSWRMKNGYPGRLVTRETFERWAKPIRENRLLAKAVRERLKRRRGL